MTEIVTRLRLAANGRRALPTGRRIAAGVAFGVILAACRCAFSAAPDSGAEASPTQAGQRPVAAVPAVSEKPVIDGRPVEDVWKSAQTLRQFFAIDEGEPANPPTTVSLCAQDRRLYISAVCGSPENAPIVAERTRRDSDVFNDDSIEVLIDPVGPHGRVYRFVINSIGTRMEEIIPFDGRGTGDALPCWTARAQRREPTVGDGWTAEFEIDLASLDIGAGNEGRWRANFIRHARGPVRQDSAWARPRFWEFGCDKERMGVLTDVPTRGLATDCRMAVTDSSAWVAESVLRGRLSVEVRNDNPDRRAYSLHLRTPSRWVSTERLSVDGRSKKSVSFDYELALAEPRELWFEVVDRDRKLPAAAIAFRPKLSPLLDAWFDRSFYSDEEQAHFRVEIGNRQPKKDSVVLNLYDAESAKRLWSGRLELQPNENGIGAATEVGLPLDDLSPGSYLVETIFEDAAAGRRHRLWKAMRLLKPADGEIKVDAGGFLRRAGAPFYPLEIRRIMATDALGLNQVDEQTAFNAIWAWYLRWRSTDIVVTNLYRATECLGDVDVGDLTTAKGPRRDEMLGDLQRLADIPIVFGYGMASLPGEDTWSTESAAQARRYVGNIDPRRPFYAVLGSEQQAWRFREAADFLVVPCRAIGPDGVGEPEWVYEQIARARRQAGPRVPVVALIPAYRDPQRHQDRPDAAQVYAMTYLALVAGAAGVIYDGYEIPDENGFSQDRALREMIFSLSHHIGFLGPIVISRSAKADIVADQPPYGAIRWTAHRHAGRLYIVAVNAAPRTAYAAFRPAGRGVFRDVTEVLEKRPIRTDNSRFAAQFAPYGSHVFAIEESR
jgi:hypothetical protein